MPSTTACTTCSEKKIRCAPEPGSYPAACQRCVKQGQRCTYPPPPVNPPTSSSRKTACEHCRGERIRCVRSNPTGPCNYCAGKELECTFVKNGAPVQPVAGPSGVVADHIAAAPQAPVPTTAVQHPRAAPPPPALGVDTNVSRSSDSPRTTSPNRDWWIVMFAPSPE
ncbi:hypothetical protein C8Q77DRAFT_1155037 [Trametes polyzona]|nr:hypothetical protein C8Q77DRAFT_1155037 [Trametes polyzona]